MFYAVNTDSGIFSTTQNPAVLACASKVWKINLPDGMADSFGRMFGTEDVLDAIENFTQKKDYQSAYGATKRGRTDCLDKEFDSLLGVLGYGDISFLVSGLHSHCLPKKKQCNKASEQDEYVTELLENYGDDLSWGAIRNSQRLSVTSEYKSEMREKLQKDAALSNLTFEDELDKCFDVKGCLREWAIKAILKKGVKEASLEEPHRLSERLAAIFTPEEKVASWKRVGLIK